MELRPLGFGEIFDRAVTIYIRNLVPFVAMVMVLVLPLAILSYVSDVGSQPQLDAMIRIFQNPALARTEHFPTIFDMPGTLLMLGILLLLSYALWPFVLNAVAVGVARLYRDRSVEFRSCYETVLRRWLQIVGMSLMELAIVIGWYLALVFAVMIVAGISSYFAAGSGGALIFAIAIGAIVLCGFFLVLAPLLLALSLAMYATVLEDRPVMESIGLGFSRVFNRAEFWRAVLFALATGAIVMGGSTMFGMLGMLAGIFHLPALEAIIQSLPNAIITPFSVVILAVYYFDVRIRREGFDLEAGLDHLAAAQPA